MNDELEKFLGKEDVPEDQDTPENDEPEAEDEQPDEEQADEPEPKDEPKAESEPEKTVPLSALQQERQKGRELAQRLEAIERRFAQTEQPQQQPQVPDLYADPQGYQRYLSDQVGRATLNAQLNISEAMARETAGDEAVEQALDAAQAAGVAHQFHRERHPYGALLKWHQQQQQAAQLTQEGGLDAYAERIRKETREALMREMNADQVVKDAQSARAPSLAGKPNLGSRQGQSWAGPASLDDILAG